MSGPGAGHTFPAKEVSWLQRDVLLFANSIGATSKELHYLFELHPDFAVFPTYPVILPFKLTDQEVTDFYARSKGSPIPGVPAFDPRRVVDGQRKITVLKQLPTSSAGKKFELRNKVVGVYDKGKASVVETEQSIVEVGSGEVYSVISSSAFYVGQGGWGGPKGMFVNLCVNEADGIGPASQNYPPPAGRKPDAVNELQTTSETAQLYRLNGDYNPLHATPEPGQKMGFGGVIIHGLYSWNATAHVVLEALGGSDPKNFKEFQARFASPVRPGDKLITEMWRTGEVDGFDEILFVTKNQKGQVVLSNGRALIKGPGGPGRGAKL
ncbi:HotDog domain-containing protein [Aspergillus californicus]